jgi:hypothetical protein
LRLPSAASTLGKSRRQRLWISALRHRVDFGSCPLFVDFATTGAAILNPWEHAIAEHDDDWHLHADYANGQVISQVCK